MFNQEGIALQQEKCRKKETHNECTLLKQCFKQISEIEVDVFRESEVKENNENLSRKYLSVVKKYRNSPFSESNIFLDHCSLKLVKISTTTKVRAVFFRLQVW
jgi:hypothetical protein